MSTRCNVIIKDEYDKTILYRHSDGYPNGALPTLKKFMYWVKEGYIRDNVEQATGWLILIGAREYDEVYLGDDKYEKKKSLTEPSLNDKYDSWKCGAYEISCGIHGDIEYLYTLDLEKQTITVHKVEYTGSYDNRKQKMKKIMVIDNFTAADAEEESEKEQEKPVEKPNRFDNVDM